jgi:hypothetical protein
MVLAAAACAVYGLQHIMCVASGKMKMEKVSRVLIYGIYKTVCTPLIPAF